jgi:hypothetical protein
MYLQARYKTKKTMAIEKTANKAHVKNFLEWPKEP